MFITFQLSTMKNITRWARSLWSLSNTFMDRRKGMFTYAKSMTKANCGQSPFLTRPMVLIHRYLQWVGSKKKKKKPISLSLYIIGLAPSSQFMQMFLLFNAFSITCHSKISGWLRASYHKNVTLNMPDPQMVYTFEFIILSSFTETNTKSSKRTELQLYILSRVFVCVCARAFACFYW